MPEYFRVTRTLDAPRERVYDVLTRPEHFAIWFGTAAVTVPQDSLVMQVEQGGAFRAVMQLPDGNSIDWAGTYTEVDPPARVAMTLTDQPDDDAGLPVVFDLAEVPGGTELTISQDRSDFSDEQVAATQAGYGAFVDEMENVLARTAG